MTATLKNSPALDAPLRSETEAVAERLARLGVMRQEKLAEARHYRSKALIKRCAGNLADDERLAGAYDALALEAEKDALACERSIADLEAD